MMLTELLTARLQWPTVNRRTETPPETCGGWTAGHDAIEPKVYVLGIGDRRRVATLCRGCRDHVALSTSIRPDDRL